MKKAFLAVLLMLLAVSSAMADELVLGKQDLQNPSRFRGGKLYARPLTEAPADVTAPEGDLKWGRLTVNTSNFLFCVKQTDDKTGEIYFDRDGDFNLAEEETVTGTFSGNQNYKRMNFDVSGVKMTIKIGDVEKKDEFKFRVMSTNYTRNNKPFSYFNVYSFTVYQGSFEALDKKWTVQWMPGQQPSLSEANTVVMGGGYARVQNVHFGRKRIDLSAGNMALKEGKIVCNYEVIDDKDLIPIKVPEGLSSFMAYQYGRTSSTTTCEPENSTVYLKPGNYNNVRMQVDRKVGEDSWRIFLTLRTLKLTEAMDLSEIEPLVFKVEIQYQENGKITLMPVVTDARGRSIRLYKNNRNIPAPEMVIKDSQGNEVDRKTLTYR